MDVSKLVRMANQIALNFQAIGQDNAVAATAEHITKFWDPRMKAAIFADDRSTLSPIAAAAIERVASGAKPTANVPAHEFNVGNEVHHSDG
ncbi:MAG: formate dehydrogenase subunit delta [Pseudomonadota bacterium]